MRFRLTMPVTPLISPSVRWYRVRPRRSYFWAWYSTSAIGYDGGNVEASTDDGATWQVLENVTPPYENAVSINTCLGQNPSWSGWSTGNFWHYVSVDLSPLVGQVPIFRFRFGTYAWTTPLGFFIDDLELWGFGPASYAPVSGHVHLDGGAGLVTQVALTTNGVHGHTVHPSADSVYSIDTVQTGRRTFTVSLPGYATVVRTDTVPLTGLTNHDFTLRRLPPLVPAEFTATLADAHNGYVHLTWQASGDPLVDEYHLLRKLRDDTAWVDMRTAVGHDVTFTEDTLRSGGVWQYAITAVDIDASSPVVSGRTDSVEVSFGEIPPSSLRGNGRFDDHIHLSWFAPGVLPETELAHDDGTNEIAGLGWRGWIPTGGWIVAHFRTSDTTGVTVSRIRVFLTDSATVGDSFQVAIFPDSSLSPGLPSHVPLVRLGSVVEEPLNDWKEFRITPRLAISSGSFYVGIRQMTANAICLGGETSSPFLTSHLLLRSVGLVVDCVRTGLDVHADASRSGCRQR